MHKALSLSLATALVAIAGVASAETFAVNGGTITATKSGDDVTITVTSIPAVTLVHFQYQGIKLVAIKDSVGVLTKVSENGGRFQLKDATGKWLLITPSGNPYKMQGVVQECRKSKAGCALEVKS
ncbi:MAG: hypothetical protein GW815_00245 [Candidatus Moranbacteria bacterium]|nr:hypothetical protein [Candidatus Moranbacteria bacterium]OIQ01681.1 MAG: hypothetical protein AUK58_04125 [Candidatus Moranbacteria bacterium CG2_30_41_165]PIP25913.1 MAG: hypothetical protein COX32_00850 [Candidatus Moranbacteria bacterium CG23_combo_of_CG06-09_8_20_14_all_41_28]PIV86553.1 MAG: hypothetical protein COW50_00815 [Candidatus Moranbacteria bacterium CG17_big_fil_post_rev_8_21_14_2_50_41_107]PIX91403.1 MAG: hypothetical protein COZ27_02970 [Candidatus Moranbacteria bacterium CG_